MNAEQRPPVREQCLLKLHVGEINTGWVIANTNPDIIFPLQKAWNRFWKVWYKYYAYDVI